MHEFNPRGLHSTESRVGCITLGLHGFWILKEIRLVAPLNDTDEDYGIEANSILVTKHAVQRVNPLTCNLKSIKKKKLKKLTRYSKSTETQAKKNWQVTQKSTEKKIKLKTDK